jgi:hypothetical protein
MRGKKVCASKESPSRWLGVGRLVRELEREEISSFQGLLEGVVFLVRARFHFFRSRMRGFCDIIREKPSSLFMLGRRSNPI